MSFWPSLQPAASSHSERRFVAGKEKNRGWHRIATGRPDREGAAMKLLDEVRQVMRVRRGRRSGPGKQYVACYVLFHGDV